MVSGYYFLRLLARSPWLLVGIAATCILLGCRASDNPVPASTTTPATQPTGAVSEVATSQPPEEAGYVGVVLPREAVELTARLQLPVKSILVSLDEKVAEGAQLVELDTVAIEEELEIARQSRKLAQVQTRVAEAQVEAARKAWDRLIGFAAPYSPLAAASPLEVEEAKVRFLTAWGAEEIANATIYQQKARIEQLRHDLASGKISAPFTGIVAAVYRNRGDLAGPGVPLLRLISRESFVRFAVEPEETSYLMPGAVVSVKVPTLSVTLPARVERVAPEVDAASGRVVVEAVLEDSAARVSSATRRVEAGMVVHVYLWPGSGARGENAASKPARPPPGTPASTCGP